MTDKQTPDNTHGTAGAYVVGFVLSVALTLAAYSVVTNHLFGRAVVIAAIAALAMVQLFVQLVFFLHIGREGKPRLNLFTFLCMALVLVIVVGGLDGALRRWRAVRRASPFPRQASCPGPKPARSPRQC